MKWIAEIIYIYDTYDLIEGPLRSVECYIRERQDIIKKVTLIPE